MKLNALSVGGQTDYESASIDVARCSLINPNSRSSDSVINVTCIGKVASRSLRAARREGNEFCDL